MDSVTFIFEITERCGLMNFHQFNSEQRNRLQTIYVFVQQILMSIYCIFQSWNVLTRAPRYFPELIQTFFESFLTWYVFYVFIYFNTIHRHRQLLFIRDFLNSLCIADNIVIRQCHRKSKIVFLAFACAVTLALGGSFLEALIPLSKSELEIRRNVYRTKNPERRLPLNTHIPFIDESQSWAYEMIYIFQIYIIFCFIVSSSCGVSIIPIFMVYIRGHYEILCNFIQMIGKKHRDSLGFHIFYTNIEKNEYEIELYSSILQGTKQIHIKRLKAKIKRQQRYEHSFVKQIVKYHQKLLTLQHMVVSLIQPITIGLICANTMFYVLLLYILVGSSTQISPLRYCKFVVEFVTVMVEFFIICNSSEISDDCSGMIRNAINRSSWEKCTNQTRRELCILLRRVQRENHFKFHNGAVVLSKILLFKVVKMAYTFVNFMRFKSVVVDSRG